jgi:hypothetical protein
LKRRSLTIDDQPDPVDLAGPSLKVELAPFHALLALLTPQQKTDILDAFPKADDAKQFIGDWPRIAETAHQRALLRAFNLKNPFHSPVENRKTSRKHRRLGVLLNRALTALDQAVSMTEQHDFAYAGGTGEDSEQLRAIAAALLPLRDRNEGRRRAASRAGLRNRSGNTLRWIPKRSMGEVLVGYFRHKHWPVTPRRSGLFAAVAAIVLRQKAMNDKTLASLCDSSLDYAKQEAWAPRGVALRHRDDGKVSS